jgi:ligand-binding sensor domain-containing protein
MAVLEPILFGDVIDFRLLSDSRMMLTTTRGYATFEGEDIFLQIAGQSQQLIGTDDQERVWFFIDGDGSSIYHWDGGLDFVLADSGWEVVENVSDMEGQGVVTDGQGQIWLYTERDVRMYDGEGWTVFSWDDLGLPTHPDDELFHNLNLFYLKDNDQIWITSCYLGGPGPFGGGGVRWFEKGVWKGGGTSVREGCALALVEDDNKHVWMGVDDVLWRFNHKTASWRRFFPPEPSESLRFGAVREINFSPTGEPWVSYLLCGGASCGDYKWFRYQGGDWIQFGEIQYVPQTLVFDVSGDAWTFSQGISRIEDNQSVPMSDIVVEAVALDAEGGIWVVGHPFGGEMALWMMEGEE